LQIDYLALAHVAKYPIINTTLKAMLNTEAAIK
jgi:hypothetical protein